ncbi:hypothetical protein [Clostridium drakei]|uniref:Uncharacterized protein n=1 Tax=Clostridium drakei TaxID=332101 RepID=A0A2U8DN17_9CLOT|nr:hypothetical protein [Clostridium drakei]AWI03572.1 hypothetical protein B9W14_03435 [Clostridium drakei]
MDSVDEVDENDLLIEKINKSGTDKLDELKKMMNTQIKDSLNCDENAKNNMINQQIQLTKSLKENEEVKRKFIKGIETTKQLIKIIGPIQKDFEEYLCILNEDYKKYKENTTKMLSDVNEAVKDKLGFTTIELIKTFDQES